MNPNLPSSSTNHPNGHVVEWTRAMGPNCVECRQTDRHVMITGYHNTDGRDVFVDLFLTREQAVALHEELGRRIAEERE